MTDPSILDEAAAIVNGTRREAYGHPADNFAAIGRAWAAMLTVHLGQPIDDLPPRLVAVLMVAMKACRDAHSPKRDNLVDMAGYAEAAHAAGGVRYPESFADVPPPACDHPDPRVTHYPPTEPGDVAVLRWECACGASGAKVQGDLPRFRAVPLMLAALDRAHSDELRVVNRWTSCASCATEGECFARLRCVERDGWDATKPTTCAMPCSLGAPLCEGDCSNEGRCLMADEPEPAA